MTPGEETMHDQDTDSSKRLSGSSGTSVENKNEEDMDEAEKWPGSARRFSVPLSKRHLADSVKDRLHSVVERKESETSHRSSSGSSKKDSTSA